VFVGAGASTVVDENIGHIGQLKNKMEEFKGLTAYCSLHCILHKEALCAKSLNHVWAVVKTVIFALCRCF
jgi:hypothetical protein